MLQTQKNQQANRAPCRVDLSLPVYVASRPEGMNLPSDAAFSKLVTAEYREIEEKVERSGPFRRKQVARFNPVQTIISEKFTLLNGATSEELLSGRPVNNGPSAAATQWVTLERRGQEWLIRPVVQWVELRKPAPAADDDAERKLREIRAREAVEKRKFERRFARAGDEEGAASKTGGRAKRRRAGGAGEGEGGTGIDSAVAVQGVREEEGAWEGDEAFSDDDELVSDEEVQKDEEAVEVEDDETEHVDNLGDEAAAAAAAVRDVFAQEVAKIFSTEKEKTLQATQEQLFDEPPPEQDFSSSDEDETPPISPEAAPAPARQAPAPQRALSKQEEISLRLKDLFFRNEYALDVALVSKHFGYTREQPEYKILYDTIKQSADLVGRTLHLKPHLRR